MTRRDNLQYTTVGEITTEYMLYADFQGRVKFPIGGKARAKPASRKADPVRCRGRRLQSGWKRVIQPMMAAHAQVHAWRAGDAILTPW